MGLAWGSLQLSLNTVSSEPHNGFYDHLNSPVFFVSLASRLFVFPLCFFPCVFSPVFFPGFLPLFHFPLFLFTVFFLVFPTHPHTLSPQSVLPHPLPSLFIQSLVSFVLCICLKIGLGRETFSCENDRSVRWILWKALQSDRALFPWEDYYIVILSCAKILDTFFGAEHALSVDQTRCAFLKLLTMRPELTHLPSNRCRMVCEPSVSI